MSLSGQCEPLGNMVNLGSEWACYCPCAKVTLSKVHKGYSIRNRTPSYKLLVPYCMLLLWTHIDMSIRVGCTDEELDNYFGNWLNDLNPCYHQASWVFMVTFLSTTAVLQLIQKVFIALFLLRVLLVSYCILWCSNLHVLCYMLFLLYSNHLSISVPSWIIPWWFHPIVALWHNLSV